MYDLPAKFNEDWLADERCSNHLFAAEVAIHKVLMKSPIRTLDPYEADFFFMPVYVSCKFSPKTGFPWLGHASKLMQAAVKYVSTKMEFWNRNGGRDHIFVAAHDYGACFHTLVRLQIFCAFSFHSRTETLIRKHTAYFVVSSSDSESTHGLHVHGKLS